MTRLNSDLRPFAFVRLALFFTFAALATGSGCGCDEPPGGTDGGGNVTPDCPVGTAGCPCDGDTCGDDLICENDTCAACVFGTRDCPCTGGAGGSCDSGDVCDATDGTCRAPSQCEMAGCGQYQLCDEPTGQDAVCLDDCESGYEWVSSSSSCVAVESCNSSDPGYVDCGDRVCEPGDGGVACGACDMGLAEVDGGCVMNDCATLCPGRECTESGGDAGPTCGDCLDGWLDDGNGNCLDLVVCSELNCGSDFCVEARAPSTNAECKAVSVCVASNQVENDQGNCVPCANCYTNGTANDGVNGIGNGGYADGSICVCDLKDGYFQSTPEGDVKKCDADGDGWVNADLDPVRQFHDTHPLKVNQKCTVRSVDRFELRADSTAHNGPSTTRTISVDALVARWGLSAVRQDAAGKRFVELIEPEFLDDEDEFQRRYLDTAVPGVRLYNYGGWTNTTPPPDGGVPDGGIVDDPSLPDHRFTAAEVNPLTKACNHDDDDLNFDGIKDVIQSHDVIGGQLETVTGVDIPVFYRMTYFIELHRAWWQDRTGDCTQSEINAGVCHGGYVIAEKSRTLGDADPMGLEVGYSDHTTDYWQTCARGRDPSYGGTSVPATDPVNFDFAIWHNGTGEGDGGPECASGEIGGCESVVDINGFQHEFVPYDGRTLPTEGQIPGQPATTLDDASARFVGMNHHSQFKCVQFGNHTKTQYANANTHRQPPAGDYALNDCRLEPRQQDGIAGGDMTANPLDPRFSCMAYSTTDPADNAARGALEDTFDYNYFAAVENAAPENDYSTNLPDYAGGCVDEGAEWGPFLCVVPTGTEPVDPENYGKLFCGCGIDRAGVLCEIGCPERYRFQNRTGNAATLGLEGYWACMMPTASGGETLSDGVDGGYRVRGFVPSEVTPLTELCEPGDGGCALGGYTVRSWAP
jgi:hypothetical protein